MKQIVMYETCDGEVHRSRAEADRHLDKLYGLAISKLAHEMVRIDKYAKAQEWLDANVERIAALLPIKQDMHSLILPEDSCTCDA